MKTIKRKTAFLVSLFVFVLINTTNGLAQNYRSPKAYFDDFEKNELFVRESFAEYSTTIIDNSPLDRVQSTLDRIYSKLGRINIILTRNDKGLLGDTSLRDAFIKVNSNTINLLKNKSLILNDYSVQSELGYSELFKNIAFKENEITRYYHDLVSYQNTKAEFGLKHNIILNNVTKKNVFEYNAYQNLIFYKLNVLDEKLIKLLKEKDIEKVKECINHMVTVGIESFSKTAKYKDDFKDQSLNNANIAFITYMINQKETLVPYYINYIIAFQDLQKVKIKYEKDPKSMSLEAYNLEVRKYNNNKNLFFDTLYAIQIKKRDIINAWSKTNATFLKNNIEFENLNEKYTNLD